MKNIMKKILIYSLVVSIQIGFFASVTEAASKDQRHRHEQPRHEQLEPDRYHNQDNNRDHKICEERERHEREMMRCPNESEIRWRERQKHEKERHKEIMRALGALAIAVTEK